MNSNLSKRERNRQRWLEHIQAWNQSGLAQKVFCAQHHLGLASFQRWRRIFMLEEQSTKSTQVTFLPVNVLEPSVSCLTLLFNDNLRVEIPAGFDSATLRQVVQALQVS